MTQDKKKWNKYLIDKKINYKGNKEYEDFVIKTNAKKLHQIVTKSRANKALEQLQKSLTKIQQGTEPLRDELKKTEEIRKELEVHKSINRELRATRGILGLYLNEQFRKKANVKPSELSFLGNAARQGTVKEIISPKPDGHKREALTGAGLRRFMELMKIDNPVLIAKKFPKNQKALKISGFINIRFLCEAMNCSAEEAFLYICEGMTKTNKRWLMHRIEKEYWRGANSIVNLVHFFKEKCQQYKAKGLAKYTIRSLFKSPYLKEFCTNQQISFKSYSDFTRHFKRWKHHVEVMEEANKKKGLLN